MKLAFSTLGCPDWSLDEVIAFASTHDVPGLELRALSGSLDLLNRPEFQKSILPETLSRLSARALKICCLDTSCSFDSADRSERAKQIEVALRHCALAVSLGAPLIRVFPDRIPAGSTREQTRARIAESLDELARRAPPEVLIGLETHGDFARTSETVRLVQTVNHPRLKIIWDAANSFAAGDAMADAAQRVAPYLAHVHLRDARPAEGKEHWRPVLSGEGLVPFAEVLRGLAACGYQGYLSFEWEKYWQREIEEPERAIPDFLAAARKIAAAENIQLSGEGE